jgi:nucleoside-diphosphate-sugar epimerase
MAVNADGTANMMRAAAKCGVKKFVLLSSVSVYGPHGTDVVDEDFPCRPVGPYAISKLESERIASQIAGESGMALAILRLATVYGEGDRGNVARLMRVIDRRRFVWIGDGTNRKSLLYCGDAARACVTALNVAEGIRIYNVAAPACTVREIVDGLSASLACSVPGWHLPSRPVLALADVINPVARRWPPAQRFVSAVDKWLADDVYSGARFARDCNFDVSVTLAEGLQRLVQSYRNELGAPARLS